MSAECSSSPTAAAKVKNEPELNLLDYNINTEKMM